MEHNLLIYNPVSGRTGARDDYLGKVVQGLTDDGNELTVIRLRAKEMRGSICSTERSAVIKLSAAEETEPFMRWSMEC